MAEEEKVEFENTTVVKDLLLELLDNVCKKTEKLVQNGNYIILFIFG